MATFTGSAFQLDAPGHPLLVFAGEAFLWKSETEQNRMPLKGHFQGAVLEFGEAAMFSAQLSGPEKNPMFPCSSFFRSVWSAAARFNDG